MIREFGVDPTLIDSEANTLRLYTLLNFKNYAFIRKFPDNWEGKVRNSIKEKAKAKLRAIEILRKLSSNLIDCPINMKGNDFKYEESQIWIVNAEKYHKINPFDGFVSNKNPNRTPNVFSLASEELVSFIESNDGIVRREANVMANSVKTLLIHSKEIHFVDPYFSDMKERRLRPLKAFIDIIAERENIDGLKLNRIVFHTSSNCNKANSVNEIERKMIQKIAPSLCKNMTIEIVLWDIQDLHNRHILTDIGGVDWGIGLDDDDFNPDVEVDKITPIPSNHCYSIRGRKKESEPFMKTTRTASIIIKGLK